MGHGLWDLLKIIGDIGFVDAYFLTEILGLVILSDIK